MTHSYVYSLADIIWLTGQLGIPWHPVEKKGHDFTFSVVYVGFNWDLECHAVSLPEQKRLKYLARVTMYLSTSKVSLEDTMKVHGTLQHVSFILVVGNSYLPSVAPHALMQVKDDRHLQHHVARDVCAVLSWWQQALATAHLLFASPSHIAGSRCLG